MVKKIVLFLFIGLLFGAVFGTKPVNAQGSGEVRTLQSPGEKEYSPVTGDENLMKVYLAVAAAAGSGFLLLYLSDHGDSMTEEAKKKRVDKWTQWAK